MKKNIFYILVLLSGKVWSQTPGGVNGITKWIKSDLDLNKYSIKYEKFDLAGRQSFADHSIINYNPVLQYNELNSHKSIPLQWDNLSQVTIFTVYQENKSVPEHTIWKIHGDLDTSELTTNRVIDREETMTYLNDQSTSAVINTYIKRWRNYKNPDELIRNISFGNDVKERSYFDAKLGEFILYNKVLKVHDQQKIESYLALKYGISLKHDYINSDGKVVWPYKSNITFANRITGIGNDGQGALLQKQSENISNSFYITIGAKTIKNTNDENTAVINNKDYLIFGDNNGGISIENKILNQNSFDLLKRHWLMNVSGLTAHTISTELKIYFPKVFPSGMPVENYVLIIDRSTKGEFSQKETVVIPAIEQTPDGLLTFKNIYWDTDLNGKDIFTFGVITGDKKQNSDINAGIGYQKIELFPNPSTNGSYHLNIHLEKTSPVFVKIFDESGRLISTLSGKNNNEYNFKGSINSSSGVYSFNIVTSFGSTTRKLIVK